MGKLLYVPGDRPTPSGTQLVTLDDLEKFHVTLMMDIRKMLEGHLAKTPKRWLKSFEVRQMLKIPPGTLHTLRSTGKISYTRDGGLIFYDLVEIDLVLQS